ARSPRAGPRSAQPRHARLPARALALAPVREEARIADRAGVHIAHLLDARGEQSPARYRAQVDGRASATCGERRVDLGADLVAAGPGARPDHGRDLLVTAERPQREHPLLE